MIFRELFSFCPVLSFFFTKDSINSICHKLQESLVYINRQFEKRLSWILMTIIYILTLVRWHCQRNCAVEYVQEDNEVFIATIFVFEYTELVKKLETTQRVYYLNWLPQINMTVKGKRLGNDQHPRTLYYSWKNCKPIKSF